MAVHGEEDGNSHEDVAGDDDLDTHVKMRLKLGDGVDDDDDDDDDDDHDHDHDRRRDLGRDDTRGDGVLSSTGLDFEPHIEGIQLNPLRLPGKGGFSRHGVNAIRDDGGSEGIILGDDDDDYDDDDMGIPTFDFSIPNDPEGKEGDEGEEGGVMTAYDRRLLEQINMSTMSEKSDLAQAGRYDDV